MFKRVLCCNTEPKVLSIKRGSESKTSRGVLCDIPSFFPKMKKRSKKIMTNKNQLKSNPPP